MSNISIVLCCYNSSTRLPKTLEHLALQNLSPETTCEVIVIDNNSTDNTFELASSEWEKLGSPFPLQTIKELKPGLSHARQTGVLSAKYEYVCFCDDDNWLVPDYIQTAVEIMDSNSAIGILAGQGVAVSDVKIPNWFYTYYRAYACGVLDLNSGDVTNRQYVWGAGMVLRKSVYMNLIEAGFKHLTLDREGEKLTSGGDNELCYWHILVGFKLWYDERLMFYHFMPSNRLSKQNFNALEDGKRESSAKLRFYKNLLISQDQKKTVNGFIKAIFLYSLNERKSVNVSMYLFWLLDREEKQFLRQIRENVNSFKTIARQKTEG